MSILTKRLLLIVAVMILTFSVVAMVITLQRAESLPPNAIENQVKNFKDKDEINPDQIPPLSGGVTVLFCGVDGSNNLTDVVSLLRLDTAENKVFMLQIPRDTFIGQSYTTGKINSIYSSKNHSKSIKALSGVIEEQLMVPIDHYVIVDLSVVEQAVNKIGGVEVNIPKLINYLPGKVLYPGKQVLNGDQSIWLIRHRKGYENADLDRLSMQKEFLYSAFSSAKNVGKLKAISIASELLPKVKTDISISKGASVINTLLNMDQSNISTAILPGYGTYYKQYAVYVVNREELVPILNEFFLPDTPITKDQLKTPYPPKRAA